jgi:prepilin-type N-terminal cleavage/methylation domain-containing protein
MLREGTLTQSSTKRVRGFSLIELMVTVAIAMVLATMAAPLVTSAVRTFRFRSSVNTVAGVIQSTRYRSIYQGYPFRITFNKANGTYQISSKPTGAASYANVGNAIPFGDGTTQISADTVLQFNPSGAVTVVTGSSNFTMSRGSYDSKSLTVSTYGNVKIQ